MERPLFPTVSPTDTSRAWVNGFPKSGTHALVKACELLGLPAALDHQPFREGLKIVGIPLLVQRDPRNIVISWVRHHGRPLIPGAIIAAIRYFERDTIVRELQAYEPWRTRIPVVRFESLVSTSAMMHQLARQIGSPLSPEEIEEAFTYLPGVTLTWTGRLSQWQDVWTDKIAGVWSESGGDELVRRWGYE